MFILNTESSSIALKSASAYIILDHDGELTFPSPVEAGPVDMLLDSLKSALDFMDQKKVRTFTGAHSYHEYNAYHQCLYEGNIGAADHALILSTGTLIDMSDSCLVLVNLSETEALQLMLRAAKEHAVSSKNKSAMEKRTEILRALDEKLGLPVEKEEKKGGLFSFLHRKK